jgi:hypothetical protein
MNMFGSFFCQKDASFTPLQSNSQQTMNPFGSPSSKKRDFYYSAPKYSCRVSSHLHCFREPKVTRTLLLQTIAADANNRSIGDMRGHHRNPRGYYKKGYFFQLISALFCEVKGGFVDPENLFL